MRFGVLGPLLVWTDEGAVLDVPEAKVRAILGCLLARDGEPVSADRLTDMLWAEEPPRDPRGAVQRKIWQLRRVLDQAEPGGRDLVTHDAGGYRLRAGADAVDAGRFRTAVREAEALPAAERRRALDHALALWRGSAFGDLADFEVVRPAAARLEEERLTALELRAEARLESHEYAGVADDLAGLVPEHPFRERLRASYLRALYGAGRQREALQDYERFRRALADEFGQDPGPELAAVHTRILRQTSADGAVSLAPDTSDTAAPPATPATVTPATVTASTPATLAGTELPVALTELVGRERTVETVTGLLDESRLVTLTGPGGVGKTRLALEVAREITAGPAPDGVYLVELAEQVRHGPIPVRELAETVAWALGLRDDVAPPASAGPSCSEPVSVRLARALRARNVLLVLDNCEHVLDAAAELVADLLRTAPELRVLATSRAPLGLDGEARWPVAPLALPDAIRLFVARARAADPGAWDQTAGTADDPDEEAIATICRSLDGIPLALELAATRVRALGVRELARRLDDRFALLAGGRRAVPGRQQTLRAVIDWSWDLLCARDQTVLRRLAVFTGGCTLPAAEAVCADDTVGAADVSDALVGLVDWSLLTAVDDPGEPGGRRYRLLESVHGYCRDRLAEAGEDGRALRDRHGNHYAGFAARTAALLQGPEQARAGRLLDADYPNLVAASENATHYGDETLALRIVNGLAWYWVVRGKLAEGRRLLQAALDLGEQAPSRSVSSERARARALGWLGGIAGRQGDRAALQRYGIAALTAYRTADDRAHDDRDSDNRGGDDQDDDNAAEVALDRARTQWFLALGGLAGGDDRHGEKLAEEALSVFWAHGDSWGIAAALGVRASHAIARGDLEAVVRDGDRSRRIFTELGDGWGVLLAHQALIITAEITGDYERAEAEARDGLRIVDEFEIHGEASYFLAAIGRIALLRGDLASAADLHERAMRSAAEHGDTTAESHAAVGLAMLARREQRFDDAEEILHRWLEWDRALGWRPGMALSLGQLGFVAEERGDAELAETRHAEGLAVARETGDPRAVAFGLEGLAGANALAGRHQRAARLLGAAEAARHAVGAPLPAGERRDVDRIADRIRSGIGEGAFETERALGARLGPDAEEDRFG